MSKSLVRCYLTALRELTPYGCGLAVLIAIAGLAPGTGAFIGAGLAWLMMLTVYVGIDCFRSTEAVNG